MNLKKTAIVAALGALFSTAALAQPPGYGGHGGRGGPVVVVPAAGFGGEIERRDAINNDRIEQGIRNGQITRREAAKLRELQARVERIQARARADGVVTQGERERIVVAQRELSRTIRFERHDRQARY